LVPARPLSQNGYGCTMAAAIDEGKWCWLVVLVSMVAYMVVIGSLFCPRLASPQKPG
jgi:hypothetical protein